jgi:hypothetical protein
MLPAKGEPSRAFRMALTASNLDTVQSRVFVESMVVQCSSTLLQIAFKAGYSSCEQGIDIISG